MGARACVCVPVIVRIYNACIIIILYYIIIHSGAVCAYVYVPTCMRTCMRVDVRTLAGICARARVRIYACIIIILFYYICGCSVCVRVWVRVCVDVYVCTCMRTYMRTCLQAHVRTRVRA